jgi:hypothetical protein
MFSAAPYLKEEHWRSFRNKQIAQEISLDYMPCAGGYREIILGMGHEKCVMIQSLPFVCYY